MSETTKAVRKSLPRRYRREKIFRAIGMSAILVGLAFVVILFANIISKGYPAFLQSYIKLPIHFDEQVIDPSGERDPEKMARADYQGLVKQSLREEFPDVTGRRDKFSLYRLVSQGAGFDLKDMVIEDPALIGQTREIWLLADDEIDVYLKGNATPTSELELPGKPSASGETGAIEITGDGPVFRPVIDRMHDLFEEELSSVEKQLEREKARFERLGKDLVDEKELLAEAQQYNYPTRSAIQGPKPRSSTSWSRMMQAMAGGSLFTKLRSRSGA
ncbi:MAG: DUF3333 domain-containing protein [Gammaproteobacteria bacterium]